MIELSSQTISILKYFSMLNQSIVIKPGNRLATVTPVKNVLAEVEVAENFNETVAIYDLNRLISILSIMDRPKLELSTNSMMISDGKQRVRYGYADRSLIVTPPEKGIAMPDTQLEGVLITAKVLASVQRAAAILKVPEITIRCHEGKVYIDTSDQRNKDADSLTVELCDCSPELSMTAVFKCENLNLFPSDYTVDISQKGIARFTSTSIPSLKYFLAVGT